MQAKRSLRAEIAARVALLSAAQRGVSSAASIDCILTLEAYRSAEQVVLYRALGDEADPEGLIEPCVEAGKRVFLPRVAPGWSLAFRSWSPGEALLADEAGILCPAGGDSLEDRPTLSIVPGRAFDLSGGRLGRGRGCYDGVLGELARLGPTIGLAFECQIVDRVPLGDRDRRVDGCVAAAVYRNMAPHR